MAQNFQQSAPPGPSGSVLDFLGSTVGKVYDYKIAKEQAKATVSAPANTPTVAPPVSDNGNKKLMIYGGIAAAVVVLILILRRK